MEKEINFKDLTNEEKICFYLLQSIVKDRYLSYGYSDDQICISKVDNEWLTYCVDREQIFNLQNSSSIYEASVKVLKEVTESKEGYNSLITSFHSKLKESGIDFNMIISEKDVLWLEQVKAINQTKQDIPCGIKRMADDVNKQTTIKQKVLSLFKKK